MRDVRLFGAIMLFCLAFLWLMVWWVALYFGSWQVLLVLDYYNEQWGEGLMFHLLFAFAGWWVWKERRLR